MPKRLAIVVAGAVSLLTWDSLSLGAGELPKYYAHEAVLDDNGIIAPWYLGLDGQCDYRVRIAAETLKRYPWTTTSNAVAAYPHYVFSGSWKIDGKGAITPVNPGDWANGDLGQRATSLLNGLVEYYAYSGDPAAVAHLTYIGDFLVNHSVTPSTNPWPGMFVSVPMRGVPYGDANPHGMIQLDICASAGQGLLRAYKLTGNRRYLETARHWGDLLASHCDLRPGAEPWPRYANPSDSPWGGAPGGNRQTGGVCLILGFLDDLAALIPAPDNASLLTAREAGRRYLAETLLPQWYLDPTWGCYFWDWQAQVDTCIPTSTACEYLLEHPADFPNWRNDVRNILTLFFNRTSASPASGGDVYSGAWAYPESAYCCGRSLWYSPLVLAPAFAEWAARADDPWARELTRRQLILQTYDIHDNGVTEDNIDGGVIVNGDWFNIAHPLALRCILESIGWLPEEFAPSRENHIVRSSGVVASVNYGRGDICYSTFGAPSGATEVLRLAFVPSRVTAHGKRLKRKPDLRANGYTVKQLPNGDAIVAIRHDFCNDIRIRGKDPQEETPPQDQAAAKIARFTGNQVRVIGSAGPAGGQADVYIDGDKQLVPIDAWNPTPRSRQVLYYRNGLPAGPHLLRIETSQTHNPYSSGHEIAISAVQYSAADGAWNFAADKAASGPQRMIFGYTGRADYRDAEGHAWRPATEFVTRLGAVLDTVAQCWWTNRCRQPIEGARDPELYGYGVHASNFWVNITVGPGDYFARLKFSSNRDSIAPDNDFEITINGRQIVQHFNVAAAAGGAGRAVDVLCQHLTPSHGIIRVGLRAPAEKGGGPSKSEAFLQALEVGPSPAPVVDSPRTLAY